MGGRIMGAKMRADANPQAMRRRRETVEHPFGTMKARMGATHFLMAAASPVTGGINPPIQKARGLSARTRAVRATSR